MQCRFCGAENDDAANFCRMCGKKQREICNCGIKKKPYNCGQEKCPGYRLFLMEARKAREAASASPILHNAKDSNQIVQVSLKFFMVHVDY